MTNQSNLIEHKNKAINQKLVNYEIESMIVDSKISTVYKAKEKGSLKEVVIKTIKPVVFKGLSGQSLIRQLKNEISLIKKCSHPNMQNICDFSVDEDFAFFTLEYVEGVNFLKFIKDNIVFRLQDIIIIILQILNALKYTHDQKIMHGDLQPNKIILLKGQKIKIRYFDLDNIFNISRKDDEGEGEKEFYRSPEQLRGGSVDLRSDLYSVGMILLELIARSVHKGKTSAPIRAYQVRNDPTKLAKAISANVPKEFQEIILKSLKPKIEERFQTALGFSSALLRVYKGYLEVHEKVQHKDKIKNIKQKDKIKNIKPIGALYIDKDDSVQWQSKILDAIVENFAEYIGPLSHVIVHDMADQFSDVDELVASLSAKIEKASDRVAFSKATKKACKKIANQHTSESSGKGSNQQQVKQAPDEDKLGAVKLQQDIGNLDRLEEELAIYVGPIAGFLIKTSLSEFQDRNNFFHQLAEHIPDESDRSKFIDKLLVS